MPVSHARPLSVGDSSATLIIISVESRPTSTLTKAVGVDCSTVATDRSDSPLKSALHTKKLIFQTVIHLSTWRQKALSIGFTENHKNQKNRSIFVQNSKFEF
jgi:hypothetical protein